jgi:hypothetical protein
LGGGRSKWESSTSSFQRTIAILLIIK